MDGGRRVLRSLRESFAALIPLAPARPATAAGAAPYAAPYTADSPPRFGPPLRPLPQRAPRPRRTRAKWRAFLLFVERPGVGSAAVIALFVFVGLAGFVENGGYADMVAREGAPHDIIARAVGFPINAVTISGQKELSQSDILSASGVSPRNSLLFLDATEVRQRLIALPLVKSARVLKLYPDRLVISIEERQPHALWQRDGRVSVVSADGAVVDELRDDRFLGLPFVVGEGAEKRLAEYGALLGGLGDLASRVKAGVLIAGRRWNFIMTNGVEVKLPEQDPGAALSTLQRLQREARILDKDILSVDLRIPGRVVVRLTEEGAATRAAATAPRKGKSGGQT